MELIALLLPVAAASGWFAATRHFRRKLFATPSPLGCLEKSSESLSIKGSNYAFREKRNRAPDSVPDATESSEYRIALGNLFRHNGELEYAIDLHRRLLREPSLSEEQHTQVVFELGVDFMCAGLFDRAEIIFRELEND